MRIRMGAIVCLLFVGACGSAGKDQESSCAPERGMGVHGVPARCEATTRVSPCEECRGSRDDNEQGGA